MKKLDAENRDLRRQKEVAYGQVLRVSELKRQIERLCAENEMLKQHSLTKVVDETSFTPELKCLGIEINSTLQRLINETPDGIIQNAIEALREAQAHSQVRTPVGF